MKSCVVSLLLLLLLAANGYSLWQISLLRAEVGKLRGQVATLQSRRSDTALEAAETALAAARRGDWKHAQEALDTLSRRIGEMQTLAAEKKVELQTHVSRVRETLTKPGGDAVKRLETILHDLSANKRPESDTES